MLGAVLLSAGCMGLDASYPANAGGDRADLSVGAEAPGDLQRDEDLRPPPDLRPLPDLRPPPDLAPDLCATSGGGRDTEVCRRWICDRRDLGEGTWSGNAAACNAGDALPPGRSNALKMVNLYRFLADLPPVGLDDGRNAAAQQCALMMHANMALSHTPPTTWKCYSAAGAMAAGQSNIASGPGVAAVDWYMSDFGNETTLGHRRWILSSGLGPIGLGSTPGASCMWVLGGTGNAGKAWTAWPPPGPVPIGGLTAVAGWPVDKTGWSLQSEGIDLSRATVTVMDGAISRPVSVTQLGAWYGSRHAIRWVPMGWSAQAGHTYSVRIGNVTPAISYDVRVIDCP